MVEVKGFLRNLDKEVHERTRGIIEKAKEESSEKMKMAEKESKIKWERKRKELEKMKEIKIRSVKTRLNVKFSKSIMNSKARYIKEAKNKLIEKIDKFTLQKKIGKLSYEDFLNESISSAMKLLGKECTIYCINHRQSILLTASC